MSGSWLQNMFEKNMLISLEKENDLKEHSPLYIIKIKNIPSLENWMEDEKKKFLTSKKGTIHKAIGTE